ncbi:Spermidine Putrescine ABC transporter permease component potC (TC_3.A.1.11.1) [uncultured Candidatus Thioglobus sp.]|nr:Spermidine Putrescine ABC transporter permease component potC (TC_3.A.1.11.1) [uncultured Candidatus Thioglobus sp.]SMN01779.1 Spermidine Putrescine ABC transporter permease component potC (TC_3.A.1.11.1) [uncultured Candidatus Thioglobus sp.]
MKLPTYYSPIDIIWHYSLRVIAGLVLFFLIFPILVIIPLSFNASEFFTFTTGMLNLEPSAFSTRWYVDFFSSDQWLLAVKNSFYYASMATLLATLLGTMAAVGLSSSNLSYKPLISAILISPMIVPVIIVATGMFFFYASTGIANTDFGLIVAHAILGTPFVVITVTATLANFDRTLLNASASLGANPLQSFLKITFPLIRPGVISGALFAFVTSFDEVVVIIFLATPEQRTIPRQMFSGLREQISPTILAAATLLILISVFLLVSMELLRRRSAHISTTN